MCRRPSCGWHHVENRGTRLKFSQHKLVGGVPILLTEKCRLKSCRTRLASKFQLAAQPFDYDSLRCWASYITEVTLVTEALSLYSRHGPGPIYRLSPLQCLGQSQRRPMGGLHLSSSVYSLHHTSQAFRKHCLVQSRSRFPFINSI